MQCEVTFSAGDEFQGLFTQQDGPVYHNARQAIEEAYGMQLQNIRIYSNEDDTLANHLINASLPLKRQQIYMQNIVMEQKYLNLNEIPDALPIY